LVLPAAAYLKTNGDKLTAFSNSTRNKWLEYKCSHCVRVFRRTDYFKAHLKMYNTSAKTSFAVCDHCGGLFNDKPAYNKHRAGVLRSRRQLEELAIKKIYT
jgi:uncharacterized C2H2 Zn-finger protein